MVCLLYWFYKNCWGGYFSKYFPSYCSKNQKNTGPPMPSAAQIRPTSLAAHPTMHAQLSFTMTLRHFVKPAFLLRKKTIRENTCSMAFGN